MASLPPEKRPGSEGRSKLNKAKKDEGLGCGVVFSIFLVGMPLFGFGGFWLGFWYAGPGDRVMGNIAAFFFGGIGALICGTAGPGAVVALASAFKRRSIAEKRRQD